MTDELIEIAFLVIKPKPDWEQATGVWKDLARAERFAVAMGPGWEVWKAARVKGRHRKFLPQEKAECQNAE